MSCAYPRGQTYTRYCRRHLQINSTPGKHDQQHSFQRVTIYPRIISTAAGDPREAIVFTGRFDRRNDSDGTHSHSPPSLHALGRFDALQRRPAALGGASIPAGIRPETARPLQRELFSFLKKLKFGNHTGQAMHSWTNCAQCWCKPQTPLIALKRCDYQTQHITTVLAVVGKSRTPFYT